MGALYIQKRRCGNTIRLADYYIQGLFTKGVVTVTDHPRIDGEAASRFENERLLTMIINRLAAEYSFRAGAEIIVDPDKRTIELAMYRNYPQQFLA